MRREDNGNTPSVVVIKPPLDYNLLFVVTIAMTIKSHILHTASVVPDDFKMLNHEDHLKRLVEDGENRQELANGVAMEAGKQYNEKS